MTIVLKVTLECNECPATLEGVEVDFDGVNFAVRPRGDPPIWMEVDSKLRDDRPGHKLHFCSFECFSVHDARQRLVAETPRVVIKK